RKVQEGRGDLLAPADVHRLHAIGQAALLEHDADLPAVRGGPVVELDHVRDVPCVHGRRKRVAAESLLCRPCSVAPSVHTCCALAAANWTVVAAPVVTSSGSTRARSAAARISRAWRRPAPRTTRARPDARTCPGAAAPRC